ncbi:MAG: carboxylesterase [Gammaproteobacteria bacterium]|nr:carboxylesterase [Gammaproteobacteria bacterium]
MPELDYITHETGPLPDAAVIWLHGLGANGNDFAAIVPQLHLPSELAIRFIFPHAPVRPITINQGYPMPGWYDVTSLKIADDEDEVGIKASSSAIRALCQQQEAAGIASRRIIVAGFSQGGAVALHCGLGYPAPLGGIMALSSYLPQCAPLGAKANQGTGIFMAHGRQDDVVAFNYGLKSREILKKSGYEVIWHEYAMAHSVSAEEIQDIRHWLIEKFE